MEEFTRRVIQIIQSIPPGSVMTYGQIAALAEKPGAARQVSRILSSCSEKYSLPWHRVINARYKISLPGLAGQKQRDLLEAEGVLVLGGIVHPAN